MSAEVPYLRVKILNIIHHDQNSFTQGLFIHNNKLYESTGLRGKSKIIVKDLSKPQKTADHLFDFKIIKIAHLPSLHFGEGITHNHQNLIQLTWTSGEVFFRDLNNLKVITKKNYPGEGWGICWDGEFLIKSDGSHQLTFHETVSFEETRKINVRLDGENIEKLNELEYVNKKIYANIWHEKFIAEIDPKTGNVTSMIDASILLKTEKPSSKEHVLNGIAWNEKEKNWYLTGKNWKYIYVCLFY